MLKEEKLKIDTYKNGIRFIEQNTFAEVLNVIDKQDPLYYITITLEYGLFCLKCGRFIIKDEPHLYAGIYVLCFLCGKEELMELNKETSDLDEKYVAEVESIRLARKLI
jgi:hypothetical protein